MGVDVSKIEFELSATDRASSVFKGVESALGHVKSTFQEVLGGLGVGIGAGSIAALFGDILSKTKEAEQEANRLIAVMRNAGTTSKEELDGITEAMSSSTKFDPTSIRKAEAEILVFGNITGKTFQDVLRISADVASFMHTDLPSAAHDVAKAIAEPETAFKLLKSAGVILTDQQKDQIKHMGALGDKAGQQEVIVQKLDAAYKGMGDTMNTGLVGASDSLQKSWNELLETLGKTPTVTDTAQGALLSMRFMLDGLKAGVDALPGIGGANPWAALRKQLADQNKPSGPLPLAPDFAKGIQGLSLPGPSVGMETPEETYAREKIARQTAAAQAVITLGTARDLLTGQQKILDDQHGEGLVSLDNYYAARRDLVEKGLRAEATAVAQGIAAQNAIKANTTTPEAIAGADTAIAALNAQENKAIRGAKTENTLLTNQKRREELAVNMAAAKVLGETYAQAGDRIKISNQALADYNGTMSQGAKDLEFQTELLGKSAYEQGLLTEKHNIDLQTFQSAKKIHVENVDQMTALSQAAKFAKDKLEELYDANYAAARSWQTGLNDGINEYVDSVTNAAGQSKKLFTDFFRGSEDALVSFVRTGKADFGSLADSIITDLIRIQVQQNITGPLAGAMKSGNFFSGLGESLGFSSGPEQLSGPGYVPRATGGPFGAGDLMLVGEQGPELVKFNRGGNVIPNNRLSAAGGAPNVQIIVENKGAPVQLQQSAPRWDGRKLVINMVMEELHTDANVRNSFRQALGTPT